jgi:hypothetical protein
MAATAALRTQRHRLPSSPVRRKRTPFLMAEAEALAVMGASVFSLRPVALAPMLRLKAPQ